jgi:hypothetical protein
MTRPIVVMLALAILATPVRADISPEARAHFDLASKAYNEGDFDRAAAEFTTVYDLTEAPAILFNVAQAHRLAKRYERALFFYRTYLRLLPDAPNRKDVEEYITELEPLVPAPASAQAPASAPAPKPTAPPPTTAPVRPPVPPVPPPATLPAPVAAVPQEPVPEPPEPAGASFKRAGLVTMAVGGLLGVTSVVMVVAARHAASTITDASDAHATWSSDDQSTWDRGELLNNAALATGIAAGAAIAGGIVLYALGVRANGHESVTVIPSPSGVNLELSCKF